MNWTPMILDPSTKVVQNQILNKIKSTFFQMGRAVELGVACY